MTDAMNDEQVEIVHEFAQEIRDLLDEVEPVILELGKVCEDGSAVSVEGESLDRINSIFRLFHSMKGAAGFLNFTNISASAHSAENLLDKVRTGAIKIISSHIDLLCHGCDFFREAIDHVEENLRDDDLADRSNALKETFQEALQKAEVAQDTAGTEASPPPLKEVASANDPSAEPSTPSPQTSALPLNDTVVPEINLDLSPSQLINKEMLQSFLSEANDILQNVEGDLLSWSNSPDDDRDLIDNVFRNIHSYKGNCGFLGFNDLEELSHQMENLMAAVKKGVSVNKSNVADSLIKTIDIHKGALDDIAGGGKGTIERLAVFCDMLNDLLPPKFRTAGFGTSPEEQPQRLGEILIEQGAVTPDQIDTALAQQNKQLGEILVEKGSVSKDDVEKALQIQTARRVERKAGAPGDAAKRQDIRVELSKLDGLINLIGELVIAENMVVNSPELKDLELDGFHKAGQHLGKIVRDLQEMAMNIRMLPVAGLFRRMIRLVHDLSRKSGKKVDLQLYGEETEVDKTVIETITDPLVHVLRNSMDHGLEETYERQKTGKPETGVIKLSAAHEEGHVLISISDDGRGLSREKLIAKAIEKNLISGDGSDMSDSEVFKLIFAPGFSTAAQITDISGRGVGMDVVRQNLNKIKGSVSIESKFGMGTTVNLRIPLTLAIIEGMLVRTGKSKYIIPIINIIESFRPRPDMVTVSPDGQEVVKVRNDLLPVVRLHELHKVEPDNTALETGILIVLEARGANFCLFVDELLGQQQTVIKGLSDYISKFGNVGGVSGCTIMGDGEVCLILDTQSLLEMCIIKEDVI